jgi:hypothetical protein
MKYILYNTCVIWTEAGMEDRTDDVVTELGRMIRSTHGSWMSEVTLLIAVTGPLEEMHHDESPWSKKPVVIYWSFRLALGGEKLQPMGGASVPVLPRL